MTSQTGSRAPSTVAAFTVLVTTRDRQDSVERLLHHVSDELAAFEHQWEIVVYDDGSRVPLSFPEDPSRRVPHVHRGSENVGLIAGRNRLIDMAPDDARYLVFLDDDVFVYNLSGALTAAKADIDDGYGIVSIPFLDLPLHKKSRVSSNRLLLDLDPQSNDVVFFYGGCCVVSPTVFQRVGKLEEGYYRGHEEEDLALRLFSLGIKLKVLYGCNTIGIHDRGSAGRSDAYYVVSLSNRLAFHHKFVRSRILRGALDLIYMGLYLAKMRSLSPMRDALTRYREVRETVSIQRLNTGVVLAFLAKRYLNLSTP